MRLAPRSVRSRVVVVSLLAWVSFAFTGSAQTRTGVGKPVAEVPTDFGDGITARLESLTRVGNALVVRVALHNGTAAIVFGKDGRKTQVMFGRATIVDLKQSKKYEPMAVGGWILAGPGTRGAVTSGGPAQASTGKRSPRSARLAKGKQPSTEIAPSGSIDNTLEFGRPFGDELDPGESARMWIVFPAPASDAGDLTINIPGLAAFDGVPASAVTRVEQPVSAPVSQSLGVPGVSVALTEAKRAGDRLTVTLSVRNDGLPGAKGRTGDFPRDNSTFKDLFLRYADAVVLDMQSQKVYAPVRDPAGKVVARPMSRPDTNWHQFGGLRSPDPTRFIKAGNQITVSLTFQAPPAEVDGVFVYIPDLPPLFEYVAMSGQGVALGGGGRSFSGQVTDLEGALKDLGARVTDTEIQIQLASDVLFDFDKADIRPDAATALKNVAVVINANPGGAVRIEGHTDSQGADDYNMTLSERRAESVKSWLATNEGVAASRLVTRGWGESKPIAANESADGRQRNRRVEIIVARRK